MDFITIKGNELTVSMANVDETFKRNLAHLKNYNKVDYLQGVIHDAAVLADAYANHIFATDADSLDNLRNAFSKVLSDDRVAAKGHKCDVMEFENPVNVSQEMIFLC